MPEIEDVMPTNLPEVVANELRLDNLFKLKDGSFAIVDYESGYNEANKLKYLNYIARVEQRLYNEFGKPVPLRVIVIYTSDVEEGTTNPVFDAGCLRFEITESFLLGLDSEEIYNRIYGKLWVSEELSDKELLELVIYPLTFKGRDAKRKAVTRAIDFIFSIKGDEQKYFVAKLILAFTDKVISQEDAERIRRILMMTKVEQLMYNDFLKKANIDMDVIREEAMKEAKEEEAEKANKEKFAAIENLLKNGVALEIISISYGLSELEIQKIKDCVPQEV